MVDYSLLCSTAKLLSIPIRVATCVLLCGKCQKWRERSIYELSSGIASGFSLKSEKCCVRQCGGARTPHFLDSGRLRKFNAYLLIRCTLCNRCVLCLSVIRSLFIHRLSLDTMKTTCCSLIDVSIFITKKIFSVKFY